VCREAKNVGGLIFFCYNDYRTHIGDKGTGVMKQRIHGIVDLLGYRKPSYPALREESSPIESLHCSGNPNAFTLSLRTRDSVPAYKSPDTKCAEFSMDLGAFPSSAGRHHSRS
jgi:beta-galactosidase